MKLTRRTDYALRTLLYLAVRRDEKLHSRNDVATAFDMSAHHVAKITADLADYGYIETQRGRTGGIRLDADPDEISVGEVVRRFEPNFEVTQCMSGESTCPISTVCGLRFLLDRALTDFLETLDQFTIADIARREGALRQALDLEEPTTN